MNKQEVANARELLKGNPKNTRSFMDWVHGLTSALESALDTLEKTDLPEAETAHEELSCECHERDSSYACRKCFNDGYRGHCDPQPPECQHRNSKPAVVMDPGITEILGTAIWKCEECGKERPRDLR